MSEDSVRHRRSELRSFWQIVFRLPVPLERESALFLIVSVLDVMMTYLLLKDIGGITGRTIFYESNPVARYFLEGWGLRGIVYFKFGMVAIVEVIAHIVAFKHMMVARRLLEFGTLAASAVVIYSMFLMLAHR